MKFGDLIANSLWLSVETVFSKIYPDQLDYLDDYEYVILTVFSTLALEFTPWDEWLGMDIDQSSLKDFSSYEIICHCLDEMTFMGFDQEEIKNEMDKIKEAVADYKNMTEEEKNTKSISLDDLMKEFDHDDK